MPPKSDPKPKKRGRPKTNPNSKSRPRKPKGTPHPAIPPTYDGDPVVVDGVDVTPKYEYETPSVDIAVGLAAIDNELAQRRTKYGVGVEGLNLKLVRYLTSIGCTVGEIAAAHDLTYSQLEYLRKQHSEVEETIEKGRELLKINLRRSMWKSAAGGAVAMQIFLAKNYLGMRDTPEDNSKEDDAFRRIVVDAIQHKGTITYSSDVQFDGKNESQS